MDDALRRLEELATAADVDEFALNTEAIRIGSDLQGLRALVERFAWSGDTLLVRAVAFPLAHAAWEFDERDELEGLVLRFIEATGSTDDAGTLMTCSNAVHGLRAYGQLAVRTRHDKQLIGTFLLRCLQHDATTVHAAVLELMGHLQADGRLQQILTPEMATAIRARLDQLAPQEAADGYAFLSALRDFWRNP